MDELWNLIVRLAGCYPNVDARPTPDGERLNVYLLSDPERRFLSLNRSSRNLIYRRTRLATVHRAEAVELAERLQCCFPEAVMGEGHGDGLGGGEGPQFPVDAFDLGDLFAAVGIVFGTVANL